MKVTNIKINYVQPQEDEKRNKLKGYAQIVLDDCLAINTIKIIVTDTKRFLIFPERQLNRSLTEGTRVAVPLVNPIKNTFRTEITEAIFSKFDSDPSNPVNSNQ